MTVHSKPKNLISKVFQDSKITFENSSHPISLSKSETGLDPIKPERNSKIKAQEHRIRPVDDETDEDEDDNNESSKGPSNAGTFSALETAMEWYEQQLECCPTQLLLLKRIRDLAAKTRTLAIVQREISDYFPQ
ncbi:uncharacterized protein TNCV_4215721 [Trichonephila clavipes]|nr:uncharacterized protein TNCV_4215721 [Trichonephila clavipes]